MIYTFDDAKAEEHRRVQYFEMFGNRAIYSEGWVACVVTGDCHGKIQALRFR